jgi:nucleoside-diphosphate-sugar epimerase
MKNAFVTGGAGFIGSHLVRKLLDRGWRVTVVDDLSAGKLENLTEKGVKIRPVLPCLVEHIYAQGAHSPGEVVVITGCFSDLHALRHFRDGDYTHVFHLAANPRVEFSVQRPATTTETNVMKTVELLTAAKDRGVDRFVFASSSAIYGNCAALPTPETAAVSARANSPYGLQKWVVEEFMELYSRLFGLKGVALRFFNVYGPGCTGDNPYATAVAAWCDKLSKGQPLRSDGDGEQTRDLVYVDDVTEALVRSAAANNLPDFVAMNVGSGEGVSNNQVLDFLRSKFQNLEIQYAPERPGDVRDTLSSQKEMKELLKWSPNTGFTTGMEKTLEWWGLSREHFEAHY